MPGQPDTGGEAADGSDHSLSDAYTQVYTLWRAGSEDVPGLSVPTDDEEPPGLADVTESEDNAASRSHASCMTAPGARPPPSEPKLLAEPSFGLPEPEPAWPAAHGAHPHAHSAPAASHWRWVAAAPAGTAAAAAAAAAPAAHGPPPSEAGASDDTDGTMPGLVESDFESDSFDEETAPGNVLRVRAPRAWRPAHAPRPRPLGGRRARRGCPRSSWAVSRGRSQPAAPLSSPLTPPRCIPTPRAQYTMWMRAGRPRALGNTRQVRGGGSPLSWRPRLVRRHPSRGVAGRAANLATSPGPRLPRPAPQQPIWRAALRRRQRREW
jgi:hypothetical protein